MSGTGPVSFRGIDWSRAVWVGVAVYAAWALGPFLEDGLPLDFDAHSHLARAAFVERAFAAGQYPGWANDWYGGYRLLEFYSPVWYWISAAVGLALRDIVLAVKVVVWAAQVASAVFFFEFVRRLTGRIFPAVLAAVLLVHCAERAMVFGVVGNYPSTLLYLGIPALLSLVWRCSEGQVAPRRLFAGQALLVGGMLGAHFANALLVLPAILAFEVTRLAQVTSDRRRMAAAFGAVAGSLVAGAALVAFATVPALLHLDRGSLAGESGFVALGRPSLEPILMAAGIVPAGFEHLFLRDHGTFWMVLGTMAGLASLFRRHRKWLPLFVGLCTNLAVVVFVNERAAIGLAFFLYPLCAVAIDGVSRWVERFEVRVSRFAIPAAALMGAITFAVDIPPPRYFPASGFDVYRAIPESSTRSRTFDVSPTSISLDGFYGASSFSPYLSGRAIPFGAYPQGASPATQVRLALAGVLAEELAQQPPTISDDALDVLYLDHVEFLVGRDRRPAISRLAPENDVGEPFTPQLLKLDHASPALFAPELASLPAWVTAEGARDRSPRLLGVLEQAWREDPLDSGRGPSLDPLFRTRAKRDSERLMPLLRAMDLDRADAHATRIFVDQRPAGGKAPSGIPAEFAVLEHDEEATRARITARASQSGYVRISYSHDPDLSVSLDGEPVETVADSLGGAIVLAFPAGTHTIGVAAPSATLQTSCLWLCLILALMLLAVLAIDRRATRSPDRRQD